MSPALPRGRRRPDVTMTSTLSRTNSAAISAKRSLRPSAQRYSIATVRPSIQPSSRSRCTKAATHWLQARRRGRAQEPDGRQLRRLLRARRERPRRRRAAEQRDELAPLHSITSSARASSVGGTSRPSALAVLRLIDQLVLGRRLHRQVGRLLALEDAIDVAGRAPVLVDQIRPVGDQAAAGDEEAVGVDRGQLVPGRQRDDQIAMN